MIGQSRVRTVNSKIRGQTFQVLASVLGQLRIQTVNNKIRGQTFQVLASVLAQSRVRTVNNKIRWTNLQVVASVQLLPLCARSMNDKHTVTFFIRCALIIIIIKHMAWDYSI